MVTNRRVCVLGAGIAGLGTAVALQQKDPSIEITIVAEKFSPELTSDIAAGLIEPSKLGDMPKEIVERWFTKTLEYIEEFSQEFPHCGAKAMGGYGFSQTDYDHPWKRYLRNYTNLTREEIDSKHPDHPKFGYYFTTYYLEPTKHLAYLQDQFLARGGKMIKQRIGSLDDLPGDYDVVVNCTGLASRFLFNDDRVIPCRGQVIRVRCPELKHFHEDGRYYALLNDDCVVLGGTAEYGEWDTTIQKDIAQTILDETIRRLPILKEAEIISHHVGLRPYRDAVRLDVSYEECHGRKVPVVHNYGHGGSGITLFWGCALDAADLAIEQLNNISRAKL